jgi:hypothetical protein
VKLDKGAQRTALKPDGMRRSLASRAHVKTAKDKKKIKAGSKKEKKVRYWT